ncbi:RNA polymerase sigma-70 factor, ECF subfamily [bacterium A37T11]|nr:RNA polymerase sigma-70 factor, ECF subfamily [bacterium A37T11]
MKPIKANNNNFVSQDEIKLLINDNQTAFKRIYIQYSEKVYSLAFHFLKDVSDSEDMVQETFLKLWINRKNMDTEGNLWVYIYVICKSLCLNKLREMSRSKEMMHELTSRIELYNLYIESHIHAKEIAHLSQKVIEGLPAQQKLVFKLSREEGLTHQQIAQQLHISVNTVKNHMVQALRTLKKYLFVNDPPFSLVLIFFLFFH